MAAAVPRGGDAVTLRRGWLPATIAKARSEVSQAGVGHTTSAVRRAPR